MLGTTPTVDAETHAPAPLDFTGTFGIESDATHSTADIAGDHEQSATIEPMDWLAEPETETSSEVVPFDLDDG